MLELMMQVATLVIGPTPELTGLLASTNKSYSLSDFVDSPGRLFLELESPAGVAASALRLGILA